jgi:hypothetical protein
MVEISRWLKLIAMLLTPPIPSHKGRRPKSDTRKSGEGEVPEVRYGDRHV